MHGDWKQLHRETNQINFEGKIGNIYAAWFFYEPQPEYGNMSHSVEKCASGFLALRSRKTRIVPQPPPTSDFCGNCGEPCWDALLVRQTGDMNVSVLIS